MKTENIQLAITIALKKEAPKSFLATRGINVHTLASLKSGGVNKGGGRVPGVLFVITGPGLKASEEAARWIRDNLNPLFVLNIGTCGITDRKRPAGGWIRPRYVYNEKGDNIGLDMRLPVQAPVNITDVASLLSINKTVKGNIPETWKKHDAIDMECYAQAGVFSETGTSFHCLKFPTDYCDINTPEDFNKNLGDFTDNVINLLGFLDINPDVSAVIPVFNREQTVRLAIDSVLEQSLPPHELIVVDDGSTDGTKKILEGYGDKIRRIYLKENSGPSRARNAGASEAGAEWIAFLDSDDIWLKEKLRNQLEYLKRYPFYRIIQSEEMWIRNGKRVNPCKHHKKPRGWIWVQSLERCLVSPSAVLLQKSLFQDYGGFNEKLPACEDYDLWIRISRRHPVGLDPSISVIKYGGHDDQISRAYTVMDGFRISSLYGILMDEQSKAGREEIIKVLMKKLNIVITGCKKRGKLMEAVKYEKMLESLPRQRSLNAPGTSG